MTENQFNFGGQIPEGYAAVALTEAMADSAVRVCVLAARQPDPSGGPLVTIRNSLDARVFLGCLLGGNEQVLEWLEVWVQETGHHSNDETDARWRGLVAALKNVPTAPVIDIGLEGGGLPAWIDPKQMLPIHPLSSAGTPWQPCKDDPIREQRGLPAYGADTQRYLWLQELGEEGSLFNPESGESMADTGEDKGEDLPELDNLVPLNPAGEGILVRRRVDFSWNDYVQALNNGEMPTVRHGRRTLSPGGSDQPAVPPEFISGTMFSGKDACGRIGEVLHLKLMLLCGMLRQVRDAECEMKRPLLNLSPASFRMDVRGSGTALPALWTGLPLLVDMGRGRSITLEEGQGCVFHADKSVASAISIYQPEDSGRNVDGTGEIRVRDVSAGVSGAVVVEGTLFTRERLSTGHGYLVEFSVPANGLTVRLSATVRSEEALGSGEYRFQSLPGKLPAASIVGLEALAGVPVSGVEFSAIPIAGAGTDLYSMAVMAVELLLTSEERSLPHAVDELLSLAREADAHDDDLDGAILFLLSEQPRWLESLGPHYLIDAECTADEALRAVGVRTWSGVLALIARLFPGCVSTSFAARCEGGPEEVPHRLFNPSIQIAAELAVQTRRLLLRQTAVDQVLCEAIRKCRINHSE